MSIVTIADLQKARALAKRLKFQGLDISVETAKGSFRHWYDPHAGKEGKTQMPYDYGYIRGSVGADGEHVDCYVGPNAAATHAYVVDQMKAPAFVEFDEQKVMLGFDSADAAKAAYLRCYDNPRFFSAIREVPMATFKAQVLSTSEHQPLVMSEQGRAQQREQDTHRPKLIIHDPMVKAHRDRLPGGLADKKKPEDFDSEALAQGLKVELEHTADEKLAREIAMDHLTEDPDYYKKLARMEAKKSEAFPKLMLLLKADKPPAGFQAIPKSTKGGYRKRVGGKWVYWYPSAGEKGEGKHAAAEWSEADFRDGNFDKTPGNWHYIRAGAGRADIHAWTQGGIDPHSAHPVKLGGQIGRLYQIVEPEPAEHPGWALLRDVNSGETSLAKHTLIYPIEHGREVRPGPKPKPKTPSAGDVTQPPPGPPTGWVAGSDITIPPYAESDAKPGTMLDRVERGHYPRKQRRQFRADADGTPRRVVTEVMAMPDSDKVKLLGEMQGVVRKAAERARVRMGVKKTPTVVEDMRSAAMEGMLHAIDNYRGGYSFRKSAMSYAEQYARLHAAREFSGGVGMKAREARLLPGFMAARSEAGRAFAEAGGQGEPPVRFVAEHWHLRKRDRHAGLESGKNDLIPLGDYSLRSGEIVTGRDKPGRLKLAQAYMEFLDGQKGYVDIDDSEGAGGAFFPGAGVGFGLGAAEHIEKRHDLEMALHDIERFDTVIGRNVYRVNAADVLKRRLGLGIEGESTRQIADVVPIYRIERGGALKQLSPRAAYDVVNATVDQALAQAKSRLDADTAGMIERARQALVEAPVARRGPTWHQTVKAESKRVTAEDVRQWRSAERDRLHKLESRYLHEGDTEKAGWVRGARQRLKSVGRREAALNIAERRLVGQPRSREWFRNAIATPVEADRDPRNEYGTATMTMTDLATGKQRQVRITSVRDLASGDEAYKSEAGGGTVPDMAVLSMVAKFPRLANLLWGSDDPMASSASLERAIVLEAMGF